MPTLPDFTSLGERPTPQPSGGIASFEPGNPRMVGIAGDQLAHAGTEIEGASDIVAATNMRQDDMVAQDAANKLKQAAITQEYDPQQGFRNVQGGNAVGKPFLDAVTQKFGETQQQLRSGLQNDSQRRLFDRYAQVQQAQFTSQLLAHQARETDKFNDDTANNTIDLSLRSMAQQPSNEVAFQTEMARINGTLDQLAQRKGLPAPMLQELKGKVLDAAYTTRITSVLQGVPGVVQSNPYLAEKMFEQVQDQLGPQAQVHLAMQVQKGVQSIQARDTARGFIYGFPPAQPNQIAPAVTGAPLQGVVMQLESGGNPDAVSPKGATSEMQVMRATAANPGYGVLPAMRGPDGQPLPGEVARVGRDYLGAMTARYNEPALVLAAYNAGPGRVDQWISKFGDPRSGGITAAEWASKIPFAETRSYVASGLKMIADQGGAQPSAPPMAPTAQQLKAHLFDYVQAARHVAEQQYPGDTGYADAVASRVESYGRLVISNQQAVQASANDTLQGVLTGTKPDGSDAPKTFDQFYADPVVKTAWDQITPEAKRFYQEHFANPNQLQKSDPKLVNDLTQRIYLPDGDPRKITQPGDISDYMGKGLAYADQQHLIKQMQEANTPEGNPFLKQVAQVKSTARDMLKSSMSAFSLAHPELAEEAAYRFGVDLDSKLKAARAAGHDTQTLFTPGSKDYVLDPSRVAAFMPTQAQITAQKAAAAAAAASGAATVPPRLAGETPAAYLARVKK
jgi:hypothetical protein